MLERDDQHFRYAFGGTPCLEKEMTSAVTLILRSNEEKDCLLTIHLQKQKAKG